MQVSLWLVVAPSADLRSLTAGAKARETLSERLLAGMCLPPASMSMFL